MAKTLEVEDAFQSVYHSPVDKHKAGAILVYKDRDDHSLTPLLIHLEQSSTWTSSILSPCTVVNFPYTSNLFYTCINVESFINLATSRSFDETLLNPVRTFFYNFGCNGEKSTAASSVDSINFCFPATLLSSNRQEAINGICKGRGCDHSTTDHCSCTHVIDISDISMGDVVEIILRNMPGNGYTGDPESSHPVHLHGYSFHVIEVGYILYIQLTMKAVFSPKITILYVVLGKINPVISL